MLTDHSGASSALRRARLVAVGAGLLLAACQRAPLERTVPAQPAPPPPPAAVTPSPAAPRAVVLPSMQLPPGPIYVCDVGGTKTPIEFPENVEALCRRHPEMGPCQYEREACRRRGGRVYTSSGEEVTTTVEKEYDKAVRRVRFQADGAPAKK